MLNEIPLPPSASGAPDGPALAGLRPALAQLDARLRDALAEAERRFGPGATSDPYRGLYLSQSDVERALAGSPGEPAYPSQRGVVRTLADSAPRLRRLGRALGLRAFERAVVLIAAAPEADLRYERVYAYLQDDVTRRRPSLDLVLSLLTADAAERESRRRHFTATAPLLASGVIELVGDPARPDASLLAHDVVLAGPAAGFLTGSPGPDPRLAPLLLADDGPERLSSLAAPRRAALARWLGAEARAGRPARLYLKGAPGSGRLATARSLARAAGQGMLALGPARAPGEEAQLDRLLARALLEARLRGWAVYLADVDEAEARWGSTVWGRVLGALDRHPGTVLLSGARDWTAEEGRLAGVVSAAVGAPPFRRRRAAWRRALAGAGRSAPACVTTRLAERFELTPLQVAGAVRAAAARGEGAPSEGALCEGALQAGARAQAGRDMGEQAQRIEPIFGMSDLVLPSDGTRQLREMCQRVAHRRRVMDDWGFGARLPLGSGVNALFSGPSGTGKTMAAQVAAGELGLDLYRIDLSRVVSKYIGETEKNLGRIFDRAEASNAILFFDEADALFGKRTEVKDAHDRYANIETGYLLQKMEAYPGVTILATNLRQNMDEAFVRRLAFHVHFPFPEEDDRVRIWERIFPEAVPLADDVDFGFLGRCFKVTGGNIKNTALAAAFLAAEERGPVEMRHLVLAMRREFQKMGKVCVETDFGPYYPLLRDASVTLDAGLEAGTGARA